MAHHDIAAKVGSGGFEPESDVLALLRATDRVPTQDPFAAHGLFAAKMGSGGFEPHSLPFPGSNPLAHTDAAGSSRSFVAVGVRSGFGRVRTAGLGLVKAAS